MIIILITSPLWIFCWISRTFDRFSLSFFFSLTCPLLEFEPCFIDVTYHRQEFVYKTHSNGLLEKISVRKRPGTVGICAAIKYKYHIDAVPHLICGGFSVEETENALIDLHFLGIQLASILWSSQLLQDLEASPIRQLGNPNYTVNPEHTRPPLQKQPLVLVPSSFLSVF